MGTSGTQTRCGASLSSCLPSAADAVVDDPTIRRCIGFARSWGYGSLVVVNLFAYRSASPSGLREADDPVGPENDGHILSGVGEAARIVVAWGCHGTMLGRDREVVGLLGPALALYALGSTLAGCPRHPLYLPKTTRPTRYAFGPVGPVGATPADS